MMRLLMMSLENYQSMVVFDRPLKTSSHFYVRKDHPPLCQKTMKQYEYKFPVLNMILFESKIIVRQAYLKKNK